MDDKNASGSTNIANSNNASKRVSLVCDEIDSSYVCSLKIAMVINE